MGLLRVGPNPTGLVFLYEEEIPEVPFSCTYTEERPPEDTVRRQTPTS